MVNIERSFKPFQVVASYVPTGDQPQAIQKLVAGVNAGNRFQTLLGITGSGKTATIAWTIEQLQRPALIIAPNKSLAAQLASEFSELFPYNHVEYFVSYYDYYQPEAYMPVSDTYIEKDSSINEEIDRMRHSATANLLAHRDTIVVASVSCIYALGSPQEYLSSIVIIRQGENVDLRQLAKSLIDIQYSRNDTVIERGSFQIRGDTLLVHQANEELITKVELFGDCVEQISNIDPVTREVVSVVESTILFPATHYVAGENRMKSAIGSIESELNLRLEELHSQNKLVEAQRLGMRTRHDIEMMGEIGYCNGIENYSRHIDGRKPGEPPHTLLDFFPEDFLVIVDESHQAIPQIIGQYKGDRSRKQTLVDFGFRLPSALDNRPLQFEEFLGSIGQCIFMSATPGKFELTESSAIVEQIVRPTGLIDPVVEVRQTKGQIDDLIEKIQNEIENGGRVLVTTLTKKMSEDLAEYLAESSVRVKYLHSDIDTLERIEILRDLRTGAFDVLVGINLLREGLDLPEVSLVAILDADKEGFLRSETSLIQTIGRAARNLDGRVIMYADVVTDSMKRAISETLRRRKLQESYNIEHSITPKSIVKEVRDFTDRLAPSPTSKAKQRRGQARANTENELLVEFPDDLDQADIMAAIRGLEDEMVVCARELRFEEAAKLRDEIQKLNTLVSNS